MLAVRDRRLRPLIYFAALDPTPIVMATETQNRIPVAGPSVSELELRYITDAAQNGWYENAIDYVKRFEQSFRKLHSVKFAASLP